MKLAGWTALAAIVLFVGMTSTAREPDLEAQVVALDFTGIDALVVSGAEVDVVFSEEQVPHALLEADAFNRKSATPTLTVKRDGRLLRLRLRDAQDGDLTVVAPTSVRRLVLQGGSIRAGTPVPELSVRTHGSVDWSGDAGALRIAEIPSDPDKCDIYGQFEIGIGNGDVGRLHVDTRDGRVDLSGNAKLGPTTLALGPFGKFTLEEAKRVPPLAFVELPPGPCAEELAKRKD